jgi:hypothetical protein
VNDIEIKQLASNIIRHNWDIYHCCVLKHSNGFLCILDIPKKLIEPIRKAVGIVGGPIKICPNTYQITFDFMRLFE